MAIDKSNSPAWVKVVIVVVAVGFILTVAVPMLGTVLTQSSTDNGAQQNQQASTSTTDTLNAIASQYTSATAEIERQLASDPTNVELLKAQAQQYFDWAQSVGQATNDFTRAQPIAALSVQYYERAFGIAPGTSGDLTDYAAVLFYSGNVEKATEVAEGVVKKDPKFQPAFFNLGVFYGAVGRTADAIKAYETALKLDPEGPDAQELQSRIAALKQQSPGGTTGTTP